MKNLLKLLFITIVLSNTCLAQPAKLATWSNTTLQDTVRLQALYDFTWVLMINHPDSAFSFAKMMQEYSLRINNKKFEAKSHLLIGMSLIEKSNYSEAEKEFNKSIQIAKSINDKTTQAMAYCNLGGAYYRKGDLKPAFITTNVSIRLAEESKNNHAIAWTNNSIGCIYMDKGEMLTAREYFLKSLAFAKLARDTSEMGVAIGNIGNTYPITDSKQMECYEQSLKWTRTINNKKMEGYVLRNIGNRYSSLNQYDTAIYYYNLSLEKALETNDKYQECLSYGYLGTTYGESGNYSKAIIFLNKCLASNKNIGDLYTFSEVYKYLYKSYKATGNTALALEAHEKFKYYNDSISNDELIKLMAQKDNEIKLQQQQEKLKSEEEKKM